MLKLKTRKGVAKRFRLTKKGKVKYAPCGKSHLNTAKKNKRLRSLRKAKLLEHKKDARHLRRLLPYG